MHKKTYLFLSKGRKNLLLFDPSKFIFKCSPLTPRLDETFELHSKQIFEMIFELYVEKVFEFEFLKTARKLNSIFN